MVQLEDNNHPRLDNVLDKAKLLEHIQKGNISCAVHPDGETQLYFFTKQCASGGAWDDVTVSCRGLIVRDDRIMARPFSRAWKLNTKGLPETFKEGFPSTVPDIRPILDGPQMALFSNKHGQQLALRDRFVSPETLWAGQCYRKQHKEASWPEGWTPMFTVVGPKFRKVIAYKWDVLMLTGMVNNLTGEEASWEDTNEWAKFNQVPFVPKAKESVDKILETPSGHKGWMLLWHGRPPLKVIVGEVGYNKRRIALETTTPLGLWEVLANRADLEPLKDKDYPPDFVEWVSMWEKRLRDLKGTLEQEVLEAFLSVNVPDPCPLTRRMQVINELREKVKDKVHLLPALIALLDDRETDPFIWQLTKQVVLGQPGWRVKMA